MLRFIFSIILTATSAFVSNGQCVDSWGIQLSGLPNGNLASSSPKLEFSLPDGSVVAASGFFNTDSIVAGTLVDTFAQAGSVNMGILVSKILDTGTAQWSLSLNATSTMTLEDIKINESGDVFLAGQFRGSMVLSDTVFQNDGTGQSYFLIKLDPSGNLVWAKTGFESGNGIGAIGVDESDIWAIISFSGSVDFDSNTYQADLTLSAGARDFLLTRIAPDGTVNYIHQIGGNGTGMVRDLEVMDNLMIIQGVFTNEMIFGSANLSGNVFDEYQTFHIAFNTATLDVDWFTTSTGATTGAGNFQPRCIAAYDQDVLIIAGVFANQSLEYGTLTISPQGTDGFVLGLNRTTGEPIWLKRIGSEGNDEITDMSKTELGMVLIGYFKSPQLVIDGVNQLNTTSDGLSDPLLLMLDEDGNLQCLKGDFGGFGDEIGLSLAVDGPQLFGLVSFNGAFDTDDHSHDALGVRDLLVIKTCLPCDTPTSIAETENGQASLNLYPNPSNTQTQLSYRSPQGTRPTLQLRDMLGRSVQTVQLPSHEGTYTLDAAGLGTGVYFCSLLNGTEVLATEKLSVIRNE